MTQLFVNDSTGSYRPATRQEVMTAALRHARRALIGRNVLSQPAKARDFLLITLAHRERECFGAIFCDAQHHVLEQRELFQGTLTQTAVYPREVVKAALAINAAGVILYHNHPSGNPEPSAADEKITQALKDALALVDVRVLDHIVIAGDQYTSFANRGLL